MGRDPNRWDGHVELSVREMGRQVDGIDAGQIIDYVDDVRVLLAGYLRATENLRHRDVVPATFTAASP